YVNDNNDSYPIIRGWAATGGQKGTNTPAFVVGPFGTDQDPTNRPLDRYVSALESWHCPSDHGDANYGANNCFVQYGNSYCTQNTVDSWRTAHVTADSDRASY